MLTYRNFTRQEIKILSKCFPHRNTKSLKTTIVCEDPSPGKMCESPISNMSYKEMTSPTSENRKSLIQIETTVKHKKA